MAKLKPEIGLEFELDGRDFVIDAITIEGLMLKEPSTGKTARLRFESPKYTNNFLPYVDEDEDNDEGEDTEEDIDSVDMSDFREDDEEDTEEPKKSATQKKAQVEVSDEETQEDEDNDEGEDTEGPEGDYEEGEGASFDDIIISALDYSGEGEFSLFMQSFDGAKKLEKLPVVAKQLYADGGFKYETALLMWAWLNREKFSIERDAMLDILFVEKVNEGRSELVSGLMTLEDYNNLVESVEATFDKKKISADDMLSIVSNIPLHDQLSAYVVTLICDGQIAENWSFKGVKDDVIQTFLDDALAEEGEEA